jgi:hypothetical protein
MKNDSQRLRSDRVEGGTQRDGRVQWNALRMFSK